MKIENSVIMLGCHHGCIHQSVRCQYGSPWFAQLSESDSDNQEQRIVTPLTTCGRRQKSLTWPAPVTSHVISLVTIPVTGHMISRVIDHVMSRDHSRD